MRLRLQRIADHVIVGVADVSLVDDHAVVGEALANVGQDHHVSLGPLAARLRPEDQAVIGQLTSIRHQAAVHIL